MRLAILTSGRQDWGILRSTALAIRDDPRFELVLLVGGMHLAPEFSGSGSLLADAGIDPTEELDWIAGLASPTAQAGAALASVGGALSRLRPDALMLVGDRFETAAAALAATIERVPIIHLHGGEETEGAIDNALRHAITKLSHLHLVSHESYARRLLALGEAPETIRVVGAPGLDNAERADLPTRSELERDLGHDLRPPVILVTLQPTTLAASDENDAEIQAVIGAIESVPASYVITLPNNDPGYAPIRDALIEVAGRVGGVTTEALGERRYWGMLKIADAMLGNSSSGLIEAPAVNLPVVNVGDRQLGRLRSANVIDVRDVTADAVTKALRVAIDPAVRARLAASPGRAAGQGLAAERIVEVLAGWTPPCPPRKHPTGVSDG